MARLTKYGEQTRFIFFPAITPHKIKPIEIIIYILFFG